MASLSHTMQRKAFSAAIDVALKRLNKDREKGLLQIIDLAQKFMGDNFKPEAYEGAKAIVQNPDHKWMKFVNTMLDELDPNVAKMTALNLGFEAAFYGTKTIRKMRQVHHCNIPWLILMDPTSACNLRCTGCWAAEYGYKLNLTYEELDDIVTQGKELGIYFYMFTGGEPLVRKADILKLCKKHHDVAFHSFTNGTLIDEEFADEMLRVGNFVPAISLEGFEEATDGRRGDGVYKKVRKAMELLRSKKLVYGISCCYTSMNYDSIASEEFYDSLIEMGAYFVWYFHYMPVGNDAAPELLPTPEQRMGVYEKIRKYRATKPLFAMDFQNDAEYVGGCIAGGHRYLHINANGDIDPCVFIHYSDSNIREKSLLETLRSPMMMAYHDNQPFNDNMLRPCPMLENPEKLRAMVEKAGAHSTDLQSPETADHLCSKCDQYARNWQPVADKLWKENRAKREHKK